MEVKNTIREVIKHNYDNLFLRFIIYVVLSSFVLFFLLFIRINDPNPLTFGDKVLYCLIPVIILLLIGVILFFHIAYIIEYNNSLINSTNIKALQAEELPTELEWENTTGMGFNRIAAYIKYHRYKFHILYIRGGEREPDRVQIQPIIKDNHAKEYWQQSSKNYFLQVTKQDWINISHKSLIDYLDGLVEWLRKNDYPQDY